MEFIAIRENQSREVAREQAERNGKSGKDPTPRPILGRQHPRRHHPGVRPHEVARGRAIIPSNINHPKANR